MNCPIGAREATLGCWPSAESAVIAGSHLDEQCSPLQFLNMVGIVQLAEHRIVVPGVVGLSPITHPIKNSDAFASEFFH